MKTNADYKNAALAALKGNWAPAVLATVIFLFVTAAIVLPAEIPLFKMQGGGMEDILSSASSGDITGMMAFYSEMTSWSSLGTLLQVFLYNVFTVGLYVAFLKLLRNGDNRVTSNMVDVAFRNYWHKVWGMLLMQIFIVLWTLLFIIPGIVKAFSYAMTPYILEENPELSANDAIDRSRAMMKGHKFDLFWLYLSFIGWGILCIFTLGIGFLWLAPYMETSAAAFYEDVKADYEVNGGLI